MHKPRNEFVERKLSCQIECMDRSRAEEAQPPSWRQMMEKLGYLLKGTLILFSREIGSHGKFLIKGMTIWELHLRIITLITVWNHYSTERLVKTQELDLAGLLSWWSVVSYTKRLWFDSWSGHTSSLLVQSPVGAHMEGKQWNFFLTSVVSLSPSLLSPL